MSEYDLIKKLAKKEHQQRSRARRERDREEKRATKIGRGGGKLIH